jgi:hypothetical protein
MRAAALMGTLLSAFLHSSQTLSINSDIHLFWVTRDWIYGGQVPYLSKDLLRVPARFRNHSLRRSPAR